MPPSSTSVSGVPVTLPLEPHYCVVVVDLVGSTQLAHQLPLPLWSQVLGHWSLSMLEVMQAWGGWILPLQGDCALACWPQQDVEAALGAAQQAHSATQLLPLAAELHLNLRLRAGVAAGELTMLHLPAPYLGDPQPCGLPLHLAQRLCGAAQPDEILVCPQVAQILEPRSILRAVPVPPLAGFEGFQREKATFYRLVSA